MRARITMVGGAMYNRISALFGALFLAGCANVSGPQPIITPDGVLPAAAGANTNASLIQDFRSKATTAAGTNADRTALTAFMRSGYALIYSRCAEYFERQGRNQQDARLGRDAIAPFVTLLTGAIALRNFADPDERDRLLSALSLGAAATTSGLDAYDRHFLFGAENIDSVRILTFNALIFHASATLELDTGNFSQAAIHLIDNQVICTPPHILALARDAIAQGQVEGRLTGTVEERQDLDIQRSLGQLLNPPSSLSRDQLHGLWWLFEGSPDTTDKGQDSDYEKIHQLLSGLPPASNPIVKTETTADDGQTRVSYDYDDDWAHEDAVRRALRNLSPTTIAYFRSIPSGGGQPKLSLFELRQAIERAPVEQAGEGFQRVTVSVRDRDD